MTRRMIMDLHASFVHFFAVTARLGDLGMPNFLFYGGRKQATVKLPFFFLNLDINLEN